MAKFMLLMYGDAEQWEAMTPEEGKLHDAAHVRFSEAASGRIVGGEELELAPNATTVRTNAVGDLITTDGPFLDTKEALGGFYLVEAEDIDEVLKLVEMLPEVRASHSGVEIRPVVFHG